jgi:hypothetical protein
MVKMQHAAALTASLVVWPVAFLLGNLRPGEMESSVIFETAQVVALSWLGAEIARSLIRTRFLPSETLTLELSACFAGGVAYRAGWWLFETAFQRHVPLGLVVGVAPSTGVGIAVWSVAINVLVPLAIVVGVHVRTASRDGGIAEAHSGGLSRCGG